MKIRILETVRPDILFIAKPGTILRCGEEYEATSNKNGAICGVCENGEKLGVRPNEFEFVELPQWVYDIWQKEYPILVRDARIVEDGSVKEGEHVN